MDREKEREREREREREMLLCPTLRNIIIYVLLQ